MNIKNMFNDININAEDKNYLIFLCFFSIILTILLFKFNNIRGPFSPDIHVYLGGALNYAGLNNFPNVEAHHIFNPGWMSNSPVICFLTSILFRCGYVNENALYIVTTVFGILGIFGMYVFLKVKFSPLLSLVGSILYNSFSLTLYYFGSGMLDTAAIGLIIWTLIFTIAASNKNPKYFVLVGILYVLTFFTRFTTAFIIALIILYILKDYDLINLIECLFNDFQIFKKRLSNFIKSREFKWMMLSICVGFLLSLIIIIDLKGHGSSMLYFSMAKGSMQHNTDINNPNFVTDKLFYVKNFANLLFCNLISFDRLVEKFNDTSWVSYLIIMIISLGALLKLNSIKNSIPFYKKNKIEIPFRKKYFNKIFLLISIFLLMVFIIGLKFNYIISIAVFWLFLVLLMSFSKKYPINHNTFALILVCLGFIVFYFAIFSFNNLKCVRYILPMFPAFVFFVIYFLENILSYIKSREKNKSSILFKISSKLPKILNFKLNMSNLIPILLIIILLFCAFNFTNTVDLNNEARDIESVSCFLLDYDHDISSKNIAASTSYKIFEWYFNNVVEFKSLTDETKGYDYLINDGELNNKNYHEIFKSGVYHVYELI